MSSREDPYHLHRFVDALRGTYEVALAEPRAGRKQSHWMWFIFPQISGLGFSPMAQRYAINSVEEARAYLRHPVLGARLLECTRAVNVHAGTSAREIFGQPDDLKFRSSMTLFGEAGPEEVGFRNALDTFFAGRGDALTLQKLRSK
jgi:uncharacterized protein (DUF1810 family)